MAEDSKRSSLRNDSCLTAIKRRRDISTSSIQDRDFFDTVIWPNEPRIVVCKEFFGRNCNRLALFKDGFLSDCCDNSLVVRLGRDKREIYLTNGRKAAEVFGLDRPKRVRLEFMGPLNMFRVIILGDVHAAPSNVSVKEEVIELSSDNIIDVVGNDGVVADDDVESDFDPYHFESDVTKAMARTKKSQVMHFPSRVSRNVFKEKIDEITLFDVDRRKNYKCRLITSNRGENEKYLGQDWYKFVKDRKLDEGDKLIFNLDDPPTKMYVEVVPQDIRR